MNAMKKTLCRPIAAVLTVLLAVGSAPGLAFADTPDRTPDVPGSAPETIVAPEYPIRMPSDEYEYDADAPWLYYDMTEEEYYEEFEPWRAEDRTEEDYWDTYFKDIEKKRRAEALQEFGFTDTDIPNIVIDGQALNFTGAKPLIRDGATLIPARAVLEALGAELGYDGKAKTVTAATGGATVVFTAGSRTAAVTRDGRTTEIELAAAPFIDAASASAYVPLRALAEGFGFEVYWDDAYKVAQIVDKAALIAEIDADFTVFNALLGSAYATAAAALASDLTEKTDVNLTAEFDARYAPYYEEYADITEEGAAEFAGAFTILAGTDGLDLVGEAQLEIEGFADSIGSLEQDPEMREMLSEL
ncbi:MAG: copper amine oxidase N-terminal domain-containing protein, partial [Clostridiales Family XIII bacterium]|nr:copper amine oxidase N-terminal domain-containing protein [Clostridiales Family XIII bacterium]